VKQLLVFELEKDIVPGYRAHRISLLLGVHPNAVGGDEFRLSDGLPDF
jgi:hypothetical protein